MLTNIVNFLRQYYFFKIKASVLFKKHCLFIHVHWHPRSHSLWNSYIFDWATPSVSFGPSGPHVAFSEAAQCKESHRAPNITLKISYMPTLMLLLKLCIIFRCLIMIWILPNHKPNIYEASQINLICGKGMLRMHLIALRAYTWLCALGLLLCFVLKGTNSFFWSNQN